MTYAFRCRNCDRLVEAEHAGDNEVPHSCPTCGKGVHFEIDAGGNPVKILDPDNWIVLSDLSAAELSPILKFHGLTTADIGAHTEKTGLKAGPPPGNPKFVEATAGDAVGSEDAVS